MKANQNKSLNLLMQKERGGSSGVLGLIYVEREMRWTCLKSGIAPV
jgi:hypothetical protein